MVVVGQYEFDEEDIIGAGAYGHVFSGTHTPTNKSVVLKRIQLKEDTELTVSMLRECYIHMELKHPNILGLDCVLVSAGCLYLVLEYLDWDLREDFGRVIDAKGEKYKNGKIAEKFMKGLLSGLAYCHSHKILHRDIKPENLLLSGDELKIADFGAARGFTTHSSTSDSPSLSPDVVTVDYRPPEVLLGCTVYSEAVDIWAAGCILGEMLSPIPSPIFGPAVNDGHDSLLEYEKKVLEKIFRFLGTPEENNWPALSKLKFSNHFQFPGDKPLGLEKLVPGLDALPDAKDLLSKLLCLNPQARISAEDALKHPYFSDAAEPKSSS